MGRQKKRAALARKNVEERVLRPDELFEKFIQLDVDASGRVSKRELGRFLVGNDIKHAFEVMFDTADMGISWSDDAKSRVVIAHIEPGSPADENQHCVPGLVLARVNGRDLPQGGARALRRAWRQFRVRDHVTLEFYEPALITHDFARALDIELRLASLSQPDDGTISSHEPISTGRRLSASFQKLSSSVNKALLLRHQMSIDSSSETSQLKLPGSVIKKNRTTLLDESKQFALKTTNKLVKSTQTGAIVLAEAISNNSAKAVQAMTDQLLTAKDRKIKRLHQYKESLQTANAKSCIDTKNILIVTALLPARAYADVTEVQQALLAALREVAPDHFNSDHCISIEEKTEALSITTSSGCEFRLLGSEGPNNPTSIHRHLLFPTHGTEIGTSIQGGSRTAQVLALGFRCSADVRAFTNEILSEFDTNNSGFLEFDEFRSLYGTHLSTSARVDALRQRVKVRFRTAEELEAIAEQEEHDRRRAELRRTMEERKQRNRIIRDKQLDRIATKMYRDCDGNLRRFEKAISTTSPTKTDQPKLKKVPDINSEATVPPVTNKWWGDEDSTIGTDDPGFGSDSFHDTALAVQTRALSSEPEALSRRQTRFQERKRVITSRAAREKSKIDRQIRGTAALARQAEWKRRLGGVHMHTAGFTNVFRQPPATAYGRKENHAACHPAMAASAYRRTPQSPPDDASTSHPCFFGLRRIPLNTPTPIGHRLGLYIAHTLRSTDHSTKAWRAYYLPPLCRGWARQQQRELLAAHDRSETIHPAFWGSEIAPRGDHSQSISPVLNGYELMQRVPATAKRIGLGVLSQRPPIARLPPGGGALHPWRGPEFGFDHEQDVCHICLGGRLGCPFCFELPPGTAPKDYAYLPDDEKKEEDGKATVVKKNQIPLHTDLTTEIAIGHHRHHRERRAELLIKSVPCGEIVHLILDCSATVQRVYHLFRSNSPLGIEDTAVMYLPTEHGLLAFDIEDPRDKIFADDAILRLPSRNTVTLDRYGLNRTGASAVVFHAVHHRVKKVIQTFCGSNLNLQHLPEATTIVNHLNRPPLTLPGHDVLQSALWKMLSLQHVQQAEYRGADDLDHRRAQDKELLDAAKRRKLERIEALRSNRDQQGFVDPRRRPIADKERLRGLLASFDATEESSSTTSSSPLDEQGNYTTSFSSSGDGRTPY